MLWRPIGLVERLANAIVGHTTGLVGVDHIGRRRGAQLFAQRFDKVVVDHVALRQQTDERGGRLNCGLLQKASFIEWRAAREPAHAPVDFEPAAKVVGRVFVAAK